MLPKLGFSLQEKYDRPITQVIALLKEAGFSAISLPWTSVEQVSHLTSCIRELGMQVQSLHAPPKQISVLWQRDFEKAKFLYDTMIKCVDVCAKLQIPTLVVHGWQGHQYTFREDDLFFGHFDNIVAYAREKGIPIAFENLEGEEYLDVLMKRYPDMGFCWDTGHDSCYPHKLDFLKEFGHRLLITHLNDNLGSGDPSIPLSSAVDKHYLPFDGVRDWEACMQRLKAARKQEILNFELKMKPDDRYAHLTLEEFIAEAGLRAKKIGKLYAESPFPQEVEL